MSKEKSKPIYNRKDLTLERYLQHSEEEGKTDREIREMYDIPNGSFTKFKKDLLAQLEPIEKQQSKVAATVEEAEPIATPQITEPESDVVLRQQLADLKRDYDSIANQLKQAIDNNTELQRQVVAANNQLTQEQQFSGELRAMVDFLEGKLNDAEVSDTPVDGTNYRALYEQTNSELEKAKIIAQDRLQTIEGLKEKITEIVLSADKQTSKFRDYEILLLERLLQELYASQT